MNNLVPIEFKNQRIMTTKVLAEQYRTEENNIKNNFKNNKSRFIEGKHYFKLQGKELNEFKMLVNDIDLQISNMTRSLMLWTDRGAARHAKILDTDEAWDVYERLEENYFNPKENKPQCIEDVLISSLQEMKALRLEINNTKEEVNELKEDNQNIRDLISFTPNQWREDTTKIINKIATKLGGYSHIEAVRKESYKSLNSNYGVDVNRRLLNKKKNMALEGCSKSKIDKINILDVIAEDKKLIQGYVSIVSKMAIKYGI